MTSALANPEWDAAIVLAHAATRDGQTWERVVELLAGGILLIDTGDLVELGLDDLRRARGQLRSIYREEPDPIERLNIGQFGRMLTDTIIELAAAAQAPIEPAWAT